MSSAQDAEGYSLNCPDTNATAGGALGEAFPWMIGYCTGSAEMIEEEIFNALDSPVAQLESYEALVGESPVSLYVSFEAAREALQNKLQTNSYSLINEEIVDANSESSILPNVGLSGFMGDVLVGDYQNGEKKIIFLLGQKNPVKHRIPNDYYLLLITF